MIWAEKIECALHDRVFSLLSRRNMRCWHGVFLVSGSGALHAGNDEHEFTATSLVWTPTSEDLSYWLHAGGVCMYFMLTSDTLSNAIGHSAESAELQILTDRRLMVHLDNSGVSAADCQYAFDLICREMQGPTTGSTMMVEAQVRAILVILWRNLAEPKEKRTRRGLSDSVLHHFRQLVETRFRDHWSIAQYAGEIDITPDRLHDICTRNLQKTPSKLVQERIINEAQQMLENTNLSLAQVSNALGFRDASYFNRFFCQKVGIPPATFRRQFSRPRSNDEAEKYANFADWP